MAASPQSPARREHRQRRLPRVSYSAPVRLSGEWSDCEPWFVPLLAQSLDLSEGGMALVTPLHLRLGAAVTCSMRLGGRQAYLVGRVVWDHTAADGTKRVGIQFLSPSDEDAGVMRRLLAIGESHPHRVNLRFDGRPDTLTALARVTRTGVALTAPLPILRRDTPVHFRFEGLGPTFHGRVERVRLSYQHGMPALRVGIRVGDAASEVESRPTPSPAPVVERDDPTPNAVEVSIAATGDANANEPREPTRLRTLVTALRQRCASVLSPPSLALAFCALGVGALAHDLLQRSLHAPSESASPTQTGTAVRASSVAPVRVIRSDAPSPVAHADEQDPAPTPASLQPAFKWRHDRRELFLPVAQSLAGLRHFRINSPPGIAIDLPSATGPQAPVRYPVPHPGVNRVDIAPWPKPAIPAQHGTRIRIWTDGVIDDYRIEATAQGVRVILPGEPTPDR